MNKKILLITLFFLTIGFAAVNTNLFLNVKSTFAYNEEDFKVYFSGGYINNLDHTNELVSGDNNKVIYTATELKEAGTNIKLSYDITNESSQFDALVVVNCTSSIDKVKITNNEENILVNAREINNGSTILSLSETITEDAVITCTMDITPLERTEENTGELTEVDTYVIYGNLVDTSNKAIANANLVIYSEEPHYVTTDEDGYLFYNGLERGSHEIYYVNDTMENIKGMTKEEVKAKAITSGEFTTTTTEEIVLKNNNKITNQGIMKTKPFCTSLEGNIWEYDYTGSEQQFISYCDGTYKIELWGASGGDYDIIHYGGYGGYSIGNADFLSNNRYYINVGGTGKLVEGCGNTIAGGYNGGGSAGTTDNSYQCDLRYYGSGGGATHIASVRGELKDLDSLKENILAVAAGGAGAHFYGSSTDGNSSYGGSGGGFKSGEGAQVSSSHVCTIWECVYPTLSNQQNAGSIGSFYHNQNIVSLNNAAFGEGSSYNGFSMAAGAGGGYYGGSGAGQIYSNGGTGYIGSSQLKSKAMYCYKCETSDDENTKTISVNTYNEVPIANTPKKGNGYAKITFISFNQEM